MRAAGLLESLTRFSGRIGRARYWSGWAVLILLQVFLLFAYGGMFRSQGAEGHETAMMWISFALLVWGSAALMTQRLHDRGKSGWWYLAYAVAPVLLYTLTTQEPNQISNQLSPFAIVANSLALGLSIAGLIDLGFMKGKASETAEGTR